MIDSNRRRFLTGSILPAASTLLSLPLFAGTRAPGGDVKPAGKPIKRTLGKTGIELPIVSMGVMRADNPALVRAALAAGMKHLDTAHGYQKGKNETMLGEVLKDFPRTSFVLATKIPPDSRDAFLAKLSLSLQRLQMEYVDILYLHGVSSRETALAPDTLALLREIKASGKARHLGLSTHKNEPEVILAAKESGVYEVVLTAYNFKQDHRQEVRAAIAEAAGAGIGIVGMKSMAGAFHDRDRTRPINCKAALKWVVQDQNVTTTIPGITTFDQLSENASVNEDPTLTPEEKADLAAGDSQGGLYCQACEQCTPLCRKMLPIPEMMRAYMYAYGYRQPLMAQDLLAGLPLPVNPCAGCGVCTVACAKGFPVAERIADISRITAVPAEFLS